jgi:hypothetical protein
MHTELWQGNIMEIATLRSKKGMKFFKNNKLIFCTFHGEYYDELSSCCVTHVEIS